MLKCLLEIDMNILPERSSSLPLLSVVSQLETDSVVGTRLVKQLVRDDSNISNRSTTIFEVFSPILT